MRFSLLYRGVERYLQMEGAHVREQIKDFINDAILDFIRTKSWDKVKKVVTFTLDGSDSYAITGIAADFEGEIALLNDSGVEYSKSGYDVYLQYSTKTLLYSILGDTIYVEGDSGTLTLIYTGRGTPYPLSADTDEGEPTLFYPDIIKQMAIVKFLKFLGDDSAQKEETELNRKLAVLRASENRIRHNGKFKQVQR